MTESVKMQAIETVLLDHAPVAILVTDRAGNVVYWNRGAEMLYGWSRQEAAGRHVSELGLCPVGQAGGFAPDETWDGEVSVRRKDGSPLVVYTRNSPLRDNKGNTVGLICVSLVTKGTNAARNADRGALPEAHRQEIGRRIARARAEAGLTQAALADRLGLTKRSLQGYEAGAVVPFKHLQELAELLGKEPQWFLFGDEPGTPDDFLKALAEREQALKDDLRLVVREELMAVFREAGILPGRRVGSKEAA